MPRLATRLALRAATATRLLLASGGLAVALVPHSPATAQPPAPALRPFTPEIALDVRSPRIAAVTRDGSRVAVTVTTRRDRTGVDHGRYGDPTYISPAATRLMVIDTQSGERTWIHEEPARIRGFAWSPGGGRLAYFLVDDSVENGSVENGSVENRSVGDGPAESARFRLRIFDAETSRAETVALGTEREIASSSPLVWSPDGANLLVGLRPQGWAAQARAAFLALTEAAVIVQDSRNDFLAWDRVRNMAARQITALVTLNNGSVREILDDATPTQPGFSADGSYITYATATRTKTSYTRRDGTEYALFRLNLAGGGASELLRNTGEERMSVSWNDAHDAVAYSEGGSVFVRRLDEEEAVDVTADHRGSGGDESVDGGRVNGGRQVGGGRRVGRSGCRLHRAAIFGAALEPRGGRTSAELAGRLASSGAGERRNADAASTWARPGRGIPAG